MNELNAEAVERLERNFKADLPSYMTTIDEKTMIRLIAFWRSHQPKEETKELVCRHCGKTLHGHAGGQQICIGGGGTCFSPLPE